LELLFKDLAKLNHKLNGLMSLGHIRLISDLVDYDIFHGLLLAISENECHNFSIIGHDYLIDEVDSLLIDVSGHHCVLEIL
jgi:hypothetical protein